MSSAAATPLGPWDLVAQHPAASVVLAIVVLSLFVVPVIWVAYHRARREGREFSAVWGLVTVGATSPGGSKPSATAAPDDTDLLLRGALAITRAAGDIATAADPEARTDGEGLLLVALLDSTRHASGVTRRASIMRVHREPNDRMLRFHLGVPDARFRKPHATFSRNEYQKTGHGLCWEAVEACRREAAKAPQDPLEQHVFYAPNVHEEPSFVKIHGHHAFSAILVAPIRFGDELLGVLCLDSSRVEHYELVDKYLVAVAANALAVAWAARSGRSGSLSGSAAV